MTTHSRPAHADPRTLWRLARPSGMPLVLALPMIGFGFGHWEWGLNLRDPWPLAWLVMAWWFLSAGTLWLNAALDRDEGEVLMGRTVPVPHDIAVWGYGALCVAVVLGFQAGTIPGLCASACAALAVAYSHPSIAWKGHPVLGPLVNIIGYGTLSPLAGWSIVHTDPTIRTLPALLLVVAWVAGTFFGAQAFQRDEDAARGYRTLVVTHGPRVAIIGARLGFAVAILGAALLAAIGWFPRLIIAACVPWLMLDRHLAAWQADPDDRAPDRARGMLKHGVVVALTVMLAVIVQHVWHCYLGGLPAGLGTAWTPLP